MASPRYAKAKGRNAENRVLALYRRVYPKAKRAGSTAFTNAASDLENLPIHVQVKARKATAIGTLYAAAVRVAGGKPVHVVTIDNRMEPLVTLLLEDLVDLIFFMQSKEAA